MSFARFTLLLAVMIYLAVPVATAQEQQPAPDDPAQPLSGEAPVADDQDQWEEFDVDSVIIDEPLDTVSYPRIDFSADPQSYIVGKVKISGLKFSNPDMMRSVTAIQPGDTITLPSDRLTVATRNLWNMRFFSDVRVVTDFRQDTVDLDFILKERTRVTRWQFADLRRNESKDLNEKLKLRRNSEFSEYLMATNLRLIREYYDEKAFRNANIAYSVDPDSLVPGNVIVTFFIEKKDKVKIKEFKFEGNDKISSKKLAKSFKKTNKVSINFFKSFKFNEKNFEEDRENLINHYRSQGYRDAEILDDSLYNVSKKRIGIWVKVKEGKQYYFRDVTWIGNSEIPTANLELMVPIRKGDIYDSQGLGLQLGTIQEGPNDPSVSNWYSNNGYLAIQVYPAETVVGDSIDLEIRVIEAKKFTIKDVVIEGNTRTNDHVIRREIATLPGDLYNRDLLIRTYSRLSSMQQFEPSSAFPSPQPNMQQNTVDLKYNLVEVPNDQLELSGGWGAGMFIASVGINFTNVSLRKLFDKKAWRPYPAGDNQILGLNVQTNGSYYRAGSISFTEPWLGGRKPTSLSVSFFTSRETNAYYLGQRASAHFGTIGGSVGIGRRLSWPDPYFNLYYGVQYQRYNLKNWSYFMVQNGQSNVVALNLTLSRNSIDDNFQYATTGSEISLSVALTPPFSAFDGKDYSDPTMSNAERYKWVEYHKWRFNAKWFFPLSSDNKLVLMARAQLGYLGHYNKHKKSPFEGFEMGGDGLAGYNLYGVETIGLRGYENGSLTPYSGYGVYNRIFSKYTAELRYPLAQTGGTMVFAHIFLEAGNAFVELSEFKPFNLKRSAGFGMKLYLPVLGLLGIDWGYGFDQVTSSGNKASGGQFHFTMGQQF